MADGIDNYKARGTYKGPIPMLKGFEADLVCYPSTGRCMATFDSPESGYAGAHDFHLDHFELEKDADHGV